MVSDSHPRFVKVFGVFCSRFLEDLSLVTHPLRFRPTYMKEIFTGLNLNYML